MIIIVCYISARNPHSFIVNKIASPHLEKTKEKKETSTMKTKPQPASVEDATEAGEAILHSKQTALRVKKPSLARHNNNNHNQQETTIIGRSICKGSVKEALETFTGERPMTIFSPSEDHSRERNEVKGHCVRKIFFTGMYVLYILLLEGQEHEIVGRKKDRAGQGTDIRKENKKKDLLIIDNLHQQHQMKKMSSVRR